MTTQIGVRPDGATVQAAVEALVPEIRSRAAEIESARRVPLDLVEQLRETRSFDILRPATHRGVGADLAGAMQVIETLSVADASVAWIVLIGGGAWVDLAGLPRATFDEIFTADRSTIVAGVFNPTGSATRVARGYEIEGRWTFASGCEHADWIYGNCIDASDGEPKMRIAVFEPGEVEIEDTWNVIGLCGTGSHDFRVSHLTLPAERTVDLFEASPAVASPLLHVPVPAVLALLVATVSLGIARAALDDVLELAGDKVPLLEAAPLAANPHFQHELGDADARLSAVRARLYEAAGEAWSAAQADHPPSVDLRARLRSSAVLAASTATAVAETAFRAAGGSSVYRTCPLQRRLRDAFAVGQHFLVRPDTLTTCGAILAGQEPDLTIF
jgi:alkylation response protein AidB-like acyl-CoA dehydrogenase